MDTDMLIGSRFVKGTEQEEKILNPKTGETILTLPEASPEQIDDAVAAAGKAFATWSRTTPGERSGYLLKLADRIEAEADAFADARGAQLRQAEARRAPRRDPGGGRRASLLRRRVPRHARLGRGRIPARLHLDGPPRPDRRRRLDRAVELSADDGRMEDRAGARRRQHGGLKPSEQTPLTTLKLAKIAAEVLPAGVLNVVVGRGETVGNALINHPKVAMISLTGDIATGKKVLTAAAKSVKRTHLELGGKAPVIVFDDADVDAVVEGVRIFGYYNAGQDCTAACRVYAGGKVYDKLVADLSSAASSIAFAESDDTRTRSARSSPSASASASRASSSGRAN